MSVQWCTPCVCRKRKAEELEEARKKEEMMMEERRKELLNEEDGYWRKRMAAEQEQQLLVDGITVPAEVSSSCLMSNELPHESHVFGLRAAKASCKGRGCS